MADEIGAKYKFKRWLLILVVVVLTIAIVLLLFFFPSTDKIVSRSVLAVAKPSPGSTLMATLQSNTLHGASNETVTVESTSDSLIENMKVCVSAPDFTVNPSECQQVSVFNKNKTAKDRPRTEFHLTPNDTSGNFKILVTATWVRYIPTPDSLKLKGTKPGSQICFENSTNCYPTSEKVAMTLGPVNVGINLWSRFAGRLARFSKDLTLPIILIFLASWLTGKANKREEEKQISHILLPKVMRLAGHYYLPMALNASNFVKDSSTKLAKKVANVPAITSSAVVSANSKELVFSLLSFFLVIRTLKDKEGGIFFTDLAAERMISTTNSIVRELLIEAIGGEAQFMQILDHLKTSIPAGEKRWPRLVELPQPAPKAWADLETWLIGLGDPSLQAIRFLFNIAQGTMRYESNMPFSHWYSNSRGKNLFKLTDEIDPPNCQVFGDAHKDDMEEFLEVLSSYRSGKEKKSNKFRRGLGKFWKDLGF